MKKSILIYFLLVPLLSSAYNNIHKRDSATWNISITPQYLFTNCFRFDVEYRLSSDDWIGLGQEYYYGNINSDNKADGPLSTVVRYNTSHKMDALSGAGLILEDKYFLNQNHKAGYAGFFFNAGLGYSQENIAYQDNTWITYQQNGNTYHSYSIANGSMKIDDIYFFMTFGVSSRGNSDNAHIDFNVGGQLQSSSTSYNGFGPGYRNYTRSIFDYQYNGAYPLLTLQLALVF